MNITMKNLEESLTRLLTKEKKKMNREILTKEGIINTLYLLEDELIKKIEERLETPAWQKIIGKTIQTAGSVFYSYTSTSELNKVLRKKTNIKNKRFFGTISNTITRIDEELLEFRNKPKKTIKRYLSPAYKYLKENFKSSLNWFNRKKAQTRIISRQIGNYIRSAGTSLKNSPSPSKPATQ
jgi:Zn-dependent metalloprotease